MKTMEKQQALLQQYLKKARVSLSKKPEGSLTISKSNHCDQYFFRSSPGEKKGVYLSKKEMKKITALAQKDYDMKFIEAAEKLYKRNERIMHLNAYREFHWFYQDLAVVYSNLSDARKKLVMPYVLPDDLYVAAWKEVKYPQKGFASNSPQIITENGERVRSKSEKMIADKLLKLEIPYRYACPIKTKALGISHPDFTLLDVWNRENIIYEHFGLLDDPLYCDQMMKKIEVYGMEGYILGSNFLCTMETNNLPIDMREFEIMIRARLPHIE